MWMSRQRTTHLEVFREHIERFYSAHPTGSGGSFGEILCFELHHGDQREFLSYVDSLSRNGVAAGCDFKSLAKKWGIPVTFLGELISHHCALLEGPNDVF